MLYNQADAFGKLPSAIIRLKTAWGAYQFDLLVLQVGREIEKGLVDGKSIETLLDEPKPLQPQGYAPLKGLVTEKVKMVNGVW